MARGKTDVAKEVPAFILITTSAVYFPPGFTCEEPKLRPGEVPCPASHG